MQYFCDNGTAKAQYMTRIIILVLIILSPLTHSEELIFGLYANEQPSLLVKQFRPTLNRMEQLLSARLGRSVSIKIDMASTYHEGINRLVSGQVDFSRFGPAAYVLGKRRDPALQLLAVELKQGKTTFNGIICTQRDSDIKSLADLRSHSFAFGAPTSTIGRYLAQHALLQAEIKPEDLSFFDYLDRHDLVGISVAAGQYDAGALKESTFRRLVREGYPLRALHVIDSTPTKPWVARSDLSASLQEALTAALIELKTEDSDSPRYRRLDDETKHFAMIESAIANSQAFPRFD